MRFFFPIRRHDVPEDLAVGGRGPGDGVCAGVDRAEDALLGRTAGGDDRKIRKLRADLSHDLRRFGGGGDVEHVGARRDARSIVRIAVRDRHDDGDVHTLIHGADALVAGRRVEHDAERTLVLGVHGEIQHARSLRQPAADAREHGDVRRHQQCLRDDRLRRERIHRDDRVRVHIADDAQVCGKHERLDAPSEHEDAARLIDRLRHAQRERAQLPVVLRRRTFFNADFSLLNHTITFLPVPVSCKPPRRQAARPRQNQTPRCAAARRRDRR